MTSRHSSDRSSALLGLARRLVLDSDPCHTAKASLREAEGMTLLWLPNRSPELNPIDTLWGQAKDVIAANKQYADHRGAGRTIPRPPGSLSAREALHTSGILSMTSG